MPVTYIYGGKMTFEFEFGEIPVPEFEAVAEFTPPRDDQPYGGTVEFPVQAKVQRWGLEILVAATAAYTGKLLFRKADPTYKGRIQYHFNKDETFYLLVGRCIIRWVANGELQEMEIGPGRSFHIPRFARHSLIALTDCLFFETSTPHFEDRMNDDARWVTEEYLQEEPSYTGEDEAGIVAAARRIAAEETSDDHIRTIMEKLGVETYPKAKGDDKKGG